MLTSKIESTVSYWYKTHNFKKRRLLAKEVAPITPVANRVLPAVSLRSYTPY